MSKPYYSTHFCSYVGVLHTPPKPIADKHFTITDDTSTDLPNRNNPAYVVRKVYKDDVTIGEHDEMIFVGCLRSRTKRKTNNE